MNAALFHGKRSAEQGGAKQGKVRCVMGRCLPSQVALVPYVFM